MEISGHILHSRSLKRRGRWGEINVASPAQDSSMSLLVLSLPLSINGICLQLSSGTVLSTLYMWLYLILNHHVGKVVYSHFRAQKTGSAR